MFVEQQLANGGGNFVKWISKEGKEYLTVDLGKLQPGNISLDGFTSGERHKWERLWKPDHTCPQDVALNFRHLWEHVKNARLLKKEILMNL